MTGAVEAWLGGQDAAVREAIEALRDAVRASGRVLEESIKWNAPSFAHEGADRVTLGVERKGGVRMVLHRGAKAADAAAFRFDDTARLAKWPAPDRGVVVFRDAAAVRAKAADVADLVRRWVDATR
jgi:hypothetical protein